MRDIRIAFAVLVHGAGDVLLTAARGLCSVLLIGGTEALPESVAVKVRLIGRAFIGCKDAACDLRKDAGR